MPILRGKEMGRAFLCWRQESAYARRGKPHLIIAAKEQGVTIQDLKLDLTSKGPRAIAVKADVKAKKLVVSGQLTIRGQAELDDKLVATLSDLACDGQGVIGKMAAAFLREKLKKLDGQKFPLMAFSLGDVALRDLQLNINGAVEIDARFGGKE